MFGIVEMGTLSESYPVLTIPRARIVAASATHACEIFKMRIVPDAWLGFNRAEHATLLRRGRDAGYPAPPAQIRTCGFVG